MPEGRDGKVLSFRVGELRLAVAAGDVWQVIRSPQVTRVPHAPACLTGIANLRGSVVPILSLARLLGQDGDATGGRVILLDRTPRLGLAVDEVTAFTAADGTVVGGTGAQLAVDEQGSRRLIDLDALLAREFGARRQRTEAEAKAPGGAIAATRSTVREIGLLGFELAGQEYALPLEHVREVLALPADIAVTPGLDDVLIGVTAYRGALLPLASLPALLGLPPRSEGGRVVVTRIGTALVGLVVDRLNSVIRAPETSIGAVPAVLNRGAGEARIGAIFRTAEGALVSILSPEHLFRDGTTAHILAEGYHKEAGRLTDSEGAETERFVIFSLGEETYGLPIAAIDEIVRLPDPVTRMPRAPAFVQGVMNFRGLVVPLIDLRRRFDVRDSAAIGRRRVLVTRIGELQAGFIVDAVSEIADLPKDRMSVTPELPGGGARLFDRVADLADGRQMVLLVDPEAMLDRVEADLLKAMKGAGSASGAP